MEWTEGNRFQLDLCGRISKDLVLTEGKKEEGGCNPSSGLGCWVDIGAIFFIGSIKRRTNIREKRMRLILVTEVEMYI